MTEEPTSSRSKSVAWALFVLAAILFVTLLVYIREVNAWLWQASIQLLHLNVELANFSTRFFSVLIQALLILLALVVLLGVGLAGYRTFKEWRNR